MLDELPGLELPPPSDDWMQDIFDLHEDEKPDRVPTLEELTDDDYLGP